MKYYPTDILRNIVRRKLLTNRINFLFNKDSGIVIEFLLELWNKGFAAPAKLQQSIFNTLIDNGYLTENNSDRYIWGSRMMFLQAINFELTYKCQYNCPHFWQSGERTKDEQELPTDYMRALLMKEVYCSDKIHLARLYFSGRLKRC